VYLFYYEAGALSILLGNLFRFNGLGEFGTKGEMSKRHVFQRNIEFRSSSRELISYFGRYLGMSWGTG
jgi:hypothetical protein